MRKVDPEQDFIADTRDPPTDPTTLHVGDRVTFTMPWMGGRSTLVTAKIKEIDGLHAELELLGFWEAPGQTAIEHLVNLAPYTKEDQEYEDSFNDPEVDEKNKKVIDNMIDTSEPQPHGYVDQDPPSRT